MNLILPQKSTLEPVCNFVQDAFSRIQSSEESNEELSSAMRELNEKSQHLYEAVEKKDKDRVRETLIEAEQAADSALAVASESPNIPDDIQLQVKEAHDRVRDLKQQCMH